MQQSMFNGRISYFLCVLDSMGKIYKDNGNDFLCRHKSQGHHFNAFETKKNVINMKFEKYLFLDK